MLKDVAKVELAAQFYRKRRKRKFSSHQYGDFPNAGSNAQDIINDIKAYLKQPKAIPRRNSIIL